MSALLYCMSVCTHICLLFSSFFFSFFFSSRRRHTRFDCDWSSDVCSSDLEFGVQPANLLVRPFARGDVAHEARKGRRLLRTDADRKSTRLNSSHSQISYAVFCLKKKKNAQLFVISRVPAHALTEL